MTSMCDTSIAENSEDIKYCSSNIFLQEDSVLDTSQLSDVDNVVANQLVKVRWKTNIYGSIIKKYKDEFVFLKLTTASLKIIQENIPRCLCCNICTVSDVGDVIVQKDYLENVSGNLVFNKNRSTVVEDAVLNKENCNCDEYKKDEYVKFRNGSLKSLGQVQSCHFINGIHCLSIKILQPKSNGEDQNVFIPELVVIRRGLNQMTKYYEGVIIDPTSILAMTSHSYDCLKLGDYVLITLRDSGQIYRGRVMWLGKVNNIDAVAFQSTISRNVPALDNLLFKGTVQNIALGELGAYIVPISVTRKISLESLLTSDRIKDITKSLKTNNVTDDVDQNIQTIHDNLDSFTVLPCNILREFLALSKAILKHLREDFISKKLINLSSIGTDGLENKDKVLLSCSVKVLDIIREVCCHSNSAVDEIAQNRTLLDTFEHIFNELKGYINNLDEIKKVFTNILIIFWKIIRSEKMPGLRAADWLLNMSWIVFGDSIDDSMRLVAELSMSFLIDVKATSVQNLATALKESYGNFQSNKYSRGVNKNDILMALGKIFCLLDVQLLTKTPPEITPLVPINTESEESVSCSFSKESYPEVEHCGKTESELTFEEYESCIRIFVVGDESQKSQDALIKLMSKLKNKEIFTLFLKKKKGLDFGKYCGLFPGISLPGDLFKTFLENSIISESQYQTAVEIAQSILEQGESSNIELILTKIAPLNEGLDEKLLYLAFTAMIAHEFEILKIALSKCKDVNSSMADGSTFITHIIQRHSKEEDIIQAIQCSDKIDVNKIDGNRKVPIILASRREFPTVFNFLQEKGAKLDYETVRSMK